MGRRKLKARNFKLPRRSNFVASLHFLKVFMAQPAIASRQIGRRLMTESFWLMLAAGSVAFIYWVSPLRDPSFQPNSGNGGSPVLWLRSANWSLSAAALSGILGAKLTTVLLPYSLRRLLSRRMLLWISLWLVLSGVLWVAYVALLLNQWLID